MTSSAGNASSPAETSATNTPLLNDRELILHSATPAQRVFPVLDRFNAFRPLLLVLAVLPAIYSVSYRSLSSADALWGLRAVRMLDAEPREMLALAFDSQRHDGKSALLVGQPPLATWLTVGTMRLLGTTSTLALSYVACVAMIAQVLLMTLLVKQLLGGRAACWAAVLTAFHGPLLMQVQSPLPITLTAACGLGAFCGAVSHLRQPTRWISPALLLGAGALALCVLAGGPAAIGIVALLLVYPLTFRGKTSRRRRSSPIRRKRWVGWAGVRSMILLILIGLIAGGWWIVWLNSQADDFVQQAWFRGPALPIDTMGQFLRSGLPRLIWEVMQGFGVFAGLLAVCLVWLVRILRPSVSAQVSSAERSTFLFLLTWFGFGLTMWLLSTVSHVIPAHNTRMWRHLTILPGIAICSFGLERIMNRQVGTARATAVLLTSILMVLLIPPVVGFGLPAADPTKTSLTQTSAVDDLPAAESAKVISPPYLRLQDATLSTQELFPSISRAVAQRRWLIVTLMGLGWGIAIGALWRFLNRSVFPNDVRCRWWLASCGTVFVLMNAGFGLAGVRCDTPDDRMLQRLRADLSSVSHVDHWTILADRPLPLPLRFTVESLWPEATYSRVTSWDGVLSQAMTTSDTPAQRVAVIEWNGPSTRPTRLVVPGLRVMPLGITRYLWATRLRTYTISRTERFARPTTPVE